MRRPGWSPMTAAARCCRAIPPGLLALLACGCASRYLVTVEDVVCPVHDKARLVGKLEYRGLVIFNPGIEDRDLAFLVDGRPVGQDETNDEGYARVKHRCVGPGEVPLEVRYRDRRGRSHSARATVFAWPEDDPVLVVDIDHTVAEPRTRSLLGPGPDRSEPLPGAAALLSDLARHFHVVYLTARPREMSVKTRRWLAEHAFPRGPLLTWDVDRYEWSATDFKKDRLDDLTDRFDQVTIGIGNRGGDHEAYRKRKLLTVLVDPDAGPRGRIIERGVILPDWAAVRRLFAANPHLYDPDLSHKTRLRLPGP